MNLEALRDHLTNHDVAGPFCMGDGPCPIGTMDDAQRVVRELLALIPRDGLFVLRIDAYHGRDTEVVTLVEVEEGAWQNAPLWGIADAATGSIDDCGYRSQAEAESALAASRRATAANGREPGLIDRLRERLRR